MLDQNNLFNTGNVKIMDYFVVSKSYKGLAEVISKIFENDKTVKVIHDRRVVDQDNVYQFDRRSLNKYDKIN